MAYVPQFEHDLFISYSRLADEGPDEWVSRFRKQLEACLKSFDCNATFWRDRDNLLTGSNWREAVADALEHTAIFLAVISRSYLGSRECRNEFDLMLAALRVNDANGKRSIFPVFMQPPKADADIPTELKELHRREFFEHCESEPLKFRDMDAQKFKVALTRLAQELTATLEQLRGAAQAEVNGRVFVADVDPGLYRERDDLCADLRDHRFRVTPQLNYLWNSVDVDRRISEDLHDAAMAIHLVTPTGLRTETDVAQARRQLTLAVETMASEGRSPPIVWISTREGAGPALAGFLAEIDGPIADQGVEVMQGSIEALKTLVYARLVPAPAPPTAPIAAVPSTAAEPSPSDDVAVLVEDGDFEAFGPRRVEWVETLDVEIVPVRMSGAIAHDAAALAGAVAASRRCLIYWGAQPEDWLQQTLRLPALMQRLRRGDVAIFLEMPETLEKRQFVTRKAHVIKAFEEDALLAYAGRPNRPQPA